MRGASLLLSLPLALCACSALLDTTGYSRNAGEIDGSTGHVSPPADGGTVSNADSGSIGPPPDGGQAPPGMGCSGAGGPPMTPIFGIGAANECIDTTEVTNAQYAQFLDAVGPNPQTPAECAFDVSYVPQVGWPAAAGRDAFPVAGVNWCDAYAFCEWAGKRLCGQISGGSLDPNDSNNAGASQWYAACSSGGATTFPYGNLFNPLACNGPEKLLLDTVAVATLPACAGVTPACST